MSYRSIDLLTYSIDLPPGWSVNKIGNRIGFGSSAISFCVSPDTSPEEVEQRAWRSWSRVSGISKDEYLLMRRALEKYQLELDSSQDDV